MNLIDQITTYIIRPTRERYHINRLGPKQIFLPSYYYALLFIGHHHQRRLQVHTAITHTLAHIIVVIEINNLFQYSVTITQFPQHHPLLLLILILLLLLLLILILILIKSNTVTIQTI